MFFSKNPLEAHLEIKQNVVFGGEENSEIIQFGVTVWCALW